MSTIGLAAERAASQERRAQREAQRMEELTPWMQYVWFLYDLYPSNPVSYLFIDTFSGPRTSVQEQTVTGGGYGVSQGQGGREDQVDAVIHAKLTVAEGRKGYDHRISRAADDVSTFLHRLPEEHTYEAWLATQEEYDG